MQQIVIAENMLTQVDSDGFTLTMMDGIIDYERDDAVAIPKSDAVRSDPTWQEETSADHEFGLENYWYNGQMASFILGCRMKDMKESAPGRSC